MVSILLNNRLVLNSDTFTIMVCDDLNELKIVVRCVLVASIEALTIDELWKKVNYQFGRPNCIQLEEFGYKTVYDFLMSIPDVVQLDDPKDSNSIVNLVSSNLSRHLEILVTTNIIRPPSIKNNKFQNEMLIPYRTQCAFIRLFIELFPKGMTIYDFVSDILSIPIFRPFIDDVETLLYNLDHIFQKIGEEKINLQPTIVNNLKEVVEEGKYSAMDIYNIKSCSLENKNEDEEIAHGLEYPLFYFLEEPIKNNIELLLNEESRWISEREICDLYIRKFGSTFVHFRRWGFRRISQMFSKLPEICCVHFFEDDVKIISAKQHSCDIYQVTTKSKKKQNVELDFFSISAKGITENISKENEGLLVKCLRNDPFLKASLNDCFLDQQIKHIDLSINESLNVKVFGAKTDFTPTLTCQHFDESNELKNLITDMKRYYFINEPNFMFDNSLIMEKQTYACFSNAKWFRGIVTDIYINSTLIIDIDEGSMHTIPFDDIRILCHKFSRLPAQAFTCHLYGIGSIDEDVLSEIVDKDCTINIVTIEHEVPSIKIKLMNSTSKNYLNDEWIKSGVAEPICSDLE